MAKFLPALFLLLFHPAWSWGAENILALLKTDCSVDDVKRQLDATPPGEINTLVDDEGKTALFYSRHLGTTLLLLAGADPNARDHEGRTPAFRAASRSNDIAYPIMLELLLLAHSDPNARDNEGITLLAWAAREGNLPAAKLLLLLGADPAPPDVAGDQSPLFFALQRQDEKMVSLLRAATGQGADNANPKDTNVSPDQKLANSARAAKLASVSDALAVGADINARDDAGATALFHAVADRRANVAALLLLNGANPNIAKKDGKTPLMQCVTGYDMASERMLMELIMAGADVNATAIDGTTALSQAVHSSNNTAAQWMIWRGASLEVHSPDGTLMQGASLNSDWPSMIELLKRAGLSEEASPLTQEKGYNLFLAAKADDLQAAKEELEKGTPADVANRYDQTPLEWAITYNHFDMVDFLMSHGANINHQHHYNGEHILHQVGGWTRAVSANAPELIEQVLKRGGNPNLVMKDGCTPLMVAARNGVTGESMELLVKATSDLNARNKEGRTALGLARQHGHAEVVKLLQAKGAQE